MFNVRVTIEAAIRCRDGHCSPSSQRSSRGSQTGVGDRVPGGLGLLATSEAVSGAGPENLHFYQVPRECCHHGALSTLGNAPHEGRAVHSGTRARALSLGAQAGGAPSGSHPGVFISNP